METTGRGLKDKGEEGGRRTRGRERGRRKENSENEERRGARRGGEGRMGAHTADDAHDQRMWDGRLDAQRSRILALPQSRDPPPLMHGRQVHMHVGGGKWMVH